MLQPSEKYQRENTFRQASVAAREAASILGEDTAVRRDGDLWLVLVPPGAIQELERRLVDVEYFSQYESDLENQTADFSSDEDDWARSEEDGWFYED